MKKRRLKKTSGVIEVQKAPLYDIHNPTPVPLRGGFVITQDGSPYIGSDSGLAQRHRGSYFAGRQFSANASIRKNPVGFYFREEARSVRLQPGPVEDGEEHGDSHRRCNVY